MKKKPRTTTTQKAQLMALDNLQMRINAATEGNDAVNKETLRCLMSAVRLHVMEQHSGVEADIRRVEQAVGMYEEYHSQAMRRKTVANRAEELRKYISLVDDSELNMVSGTLKNLINHIATMDLAVAEATIDELERRVDGQRQKRKEALKGVGAMPKENIQEITEHERLVGFVISLARKAKTINLRGGDRQNTPLYIARDPNPAFYKLDTVVYNVTFVVGPQFMTAEEFNNERKAP